MTTLPPGDAPQPPCRPQQADRARHPARPPNLVLSESARGCDRRLPQLPVGNANGLAVRHPGPYNVSAVVY